MKRLYCPKCSERADIYRHPIVKLWCKKCRFVLQEADGSMWYEKKNDGAPIWISTKDKMPNDKQRTMCAVWIEATEFHNDLAWRRCGYGLVMYIPEEKGWCKQHIKNALSVYPLMGADIDTAEITHWTPLPEPPWEAANDMD